MVNAASWVFQDEWEGTIVTAAVPTNLDLTPGASGSWVTGGYDFNGTAVATNTSWRPLHGKTAFTVSGWFNFSSLVQYAYVLGQYVDADNRVALYMATASNITFIVGDGSTTSSVSVGIDVDKLYFFAMTWDKDLNDGKVTLYLNDTAYTASSGLTNAVSCDSDFFMGKGSGLVGLTGSIYLLVMHYEKLTSDEAMFSFQAGPNSFSGEASHWYWMDEDTGTVFYDQLDGWHSQDHWEPDIVTGSATPPIQWVYQESLNASIFHTSVIEAATVLVLGEVALAFAAAVGLVIMPISTVLLAYKIKNREIDRNNFFWLVFLFFVGLAFAVGAGM